MDVIPTQERATITEKVKTKRTISTTNVDKLMNLDKATLERLEKKKKDLDAKRLKKKLQQVAEKNENLAQALTDKNQEINDLKRSVQSLNEVLNSVPIEELRCNSSIASSKLIELSKKNRQLRAELESTKNRVSKKEMEIQKLERELKQTGDRQHQDAEPTRKGNATGPMEELQSKLNAMQQKLFESRNKNSELQCQLKLAQKCLQQEVGENFNLNLLASHPEQSNWRGRSQHILHLQQKVNELKERLDMYEHHSTGTGRISSYSCPTDGSAGAMPELQSICGQQQLSAKLSSVTAAEGVGSSITGEVTAAAAFDRFTPGVRKTEIQHRAKVEALEKNIESLHVQLNEQRGKVLALKVRNKTLNDELLKYKMKACTLEEQTDFNGINLATMNEKMNLQKYQFENRVEELCHKLSNAERQRDEAQYKQEELRNKLDNMEELLASKDNYIMEQNTAMHKLEDDMKALVGDYLFSCRELRKEEFMAILDSLESEKNQLLEHNKTLTARLEQERKRYETTSEQSSKLKVRITRLEAKIRELEKELELQNERKKRTLRIAEYANSLTANSATAHPVGSFIFENSSVLSLSESNFDLGIGDGVTSAHAMEFKNQLELATEKIALLEQKIINLSEEKELDAKTFNDIINNTKHIILDTIMSHKQSNSDVDQTHVPNIQLS